MAEWGADNLIVTTVRDRGLPIESAVQRKAAEREEILSAIAAFTAKGGEIKKIPSYVSKNEQLFKMRDGEVELIGFNDLARRWGVTNVTLNGLLHKWPTLLYIHRNNERMFAIPDIERLETGPNYRLHKT